MGEKLKNCESTESAGKHGIIEESSSWQLSEDHENIGGILWSALRRQPGADEPRIGVRNQGGKTEQSDQPGGSLFLKQLEEAEPGWSFMDLEQTEVLCALSSSIEAQLLSEVCFELALHFNKQEKIDGC